MSGEIRSSRTPLGPLTGDRAGPDFDLDTGGHWDGFFTDTTHESPDVAQHLATDAQLLGGATGDDTV